MAIDPLLAQIMASVPTKKDAAPIAEPSVDQPALTEEELAQISKGINPATGTLVDPPPIPTPENFGIPEMDKLGDMPTGAFTPPTGPSSVAPQQLPPMLPPVEQQISQPAPTFAPEGSELTNAQFMGLSPDARSAVTPNGQPIDVIGNNGESVLPSTPTPEGMRRTIDPLTGNVIFASEDIANQIGAQETERLQAQQESRKDMTNYFLNQALQPTAYDRESAARERRLSEKLAQREEMRERARGGGEPELTAEERQAEAEAQVAEAKAQAARKALQDPNLSDFEKIQAQGDSIGMPGHLIRQGQAKAMGLDLLDEDVRAWIAGDSAQIPQGGEEKPSGETQGSTPATSTTIRLRHPDGSFYDVPEGEVDQAIEAGYTRA